MSVTEALLEGLMTTAVGLSVVFSVLIILMLVIMVMEKAFTKSNKKAEPAALQKQQTAPVNTSSAPSVSAAPAEDEEELIAVMTAAIAASLNTSTYNLRIKSYRRIENNSTAWNKAGIRETINSREM